MAPIKISFEQFLEALDANSLDFALSLNDYMINNGCKGTFEEKKSGLLGSYKHTKTKKSVINVLFRKQGLIVRIYGENIGSYSDFLNTLPEKMVQEIERAGACGHLTNNGCSTKCKGYDFTIRNQHFQKCRYSCFEFLVNDESKEYVKAFVENETQARLAV